MSHGRDTSPKPYGIVGAWESGEELIEAASRAKALGFTKMEGYSPYPVHGLIDIIGGKDNSLHLIALGAGVVGALAGLFLQASTSGAMNSLVETLPPAVQAIVWPDWVSNIMVYEHNVGGKPPMTWPMFVPVTFECTILFAAFATAGGMIAKNGLPKPHHPVFNCEAMTRASTDRFVLCIEADDPNYDEAKAEKLFAELNAEMIEPVMTSEGY